MNADFSGINAFSPPWELKPNQLVAADNWIFQGGSLIQRPAFIGQLTQPMSAAIAPVMIDFVDASGNVTLIFVCAGKLYKLPPGGSNAIELLLPDGSSFAFNSAGVRMCRINDWIYIIDGVGGLVRASLSGGAYYVGMNAPQNPVTVALTNIPLDPMTSTAGWTDDNIITNGDQVNIYLNGQYNSGILTNHPYSQGDPDAGGFSFLGAGLRFYTGGESGGEVPASYPNTWACPSMPGQGLYLTANRPNYLITNDPGRTTVQFYVRVDYFQFNAAAAVVLALSAYDATNTIIAAETVTFQPPVAATTPDAPLYQDWVFTFPSLLIPEIEFVNLSIVGAPDNKGGTTLIYISNVIVNAMDNALNPTLSGTGAGIALTRGSATDPKYNSSAQFGKMGGCRLTHDYGGPQDWTGNNIIAVALRGASSLVANGLAMVFDFATDDGSGGQVHHYTNDCIIASDGSYAAADLAVIDPAVLAAFRWFGVVFTADWTNQTRLPSITVGPVTASGNLSITNSGQTQVNFAAYEWYETEDQVISVGDEIEGNPSPVSASLNPTFDLAAAYVTKSSDSPVNGATTTNYKFYRVGGVFTDGFARLIASVPVGADVAYGTDPLNPYYSWNHTTGILLDNTPDTWLFLADILSFTHGVPPTGAQAMCAAGARLWLGVEADLWASGIISESAVYFNDVNLPNSPTLAIEGAEFQCGGSEYPIMALYPIGTSPADVEGTNSFNSAVISLKRNTFWTISGNSAVNYSASEQPYEPGIGLEAPLLVCRDSVFTVAFLAGDRMHIYPIYYRRHVLDQAQVSQAVEPLLYPGRGLGTQPIPSSALQGAWMQYHDGRVLIGIPAPGGTANTLIYVLDTRNQGWLRWVPPVSITGALSIPPQIAEGENYAMYAGGADGQIYLCDPASFQDQATPLAPLAPIPASALTRGMGMDSPGGYVPSVRAVSAAVDLEGTGTLNVTVTPWQNGVPLPNADVFDPYTLSDDKPMFECSGQVEGKYVTCEVEVDVTGPVRLSAVQVTTVPGRISRG